MPGHLCRRIPGSIIRILTGSFSRPSENRAAGADHDVLKRFWDVFGSLALIVLGAPIFLLLALVIRIDSDGPVFVPARARGEEWKTFLDVQVSHHAGSCRTIRLFTTLCRRPADHSIGRFLRRTSLDELPQLLNVVQGEYVAGRPTARNASLS